MVVLALGGNDAGFASIGEMCLAPGQCNTKSAMWLKQFGVVREQLRRTYGRVDREFKGTPVVVVPYPEPLYLTGRQCGQVALSGDEQAFIHEFVTRLNSTIRATAREFGFYYLGRMEGALAGAHLQLCDPRNDGRPGINFIGLRSVGGSATQRFNPAKWMHTSLHPNERGHIAMARVFQQWLASRREERHGMDLWPREQYDEGAKGAIVEQAENSPPAKPQCDLGEARTRNCGTQARRWAARQIGRVLLDGGLCLLIAGAAGGAWCVGVAFFAHRRRAYARCG
jgi:hypothetical protein